MRIYILPRSYGQTIKVPDPTALSAAEQGDTIVMEGVVADHALARWAVAVGLAVLRGASVERRP